MHIRSLPLQITASLLVGVGLIFPAVPAEAAGVVELHGNRLLELTDNNSTVRVSLDNFALDAWIVDGVNHVYPLAALGPRLPIGERYFFNWGTTFDSPEIGLESFALDSYTFSDNALSAYLRGFDNALGFRYSMELQGGAIGSGYSERYETVTLQNLSNTPQYFTLFSYFDFDLAGTALFDSAEIQPNRLQQVDVSGVKATVTVDQTADFVQVGRYQELGLEFVNSSRTTLNNTSVLEHNDVTAAFQFNRLLAPGEEVVFQFWKRLEKPGVVKDVPEPGSVLALGSAALAGLLLKKYRVTRKDADLN